LNGNVLALRDSPEYEIRRKKGGMQKGRKETPQVQSTPGRRCATTAGASRVLSRLNYLITASRYQSADPELEGRGGERRDPQKSTIFAHRPLEVDRSTDHQGSGKRGATEVGHPRERNEKTQPTYVVSVVRQSFPGRTGGRRHQLSLIVLRHLVSPIPPSQMPECPERKYEE